MFDAGLFRALMDVQAFDHAAVDSFRRSEAHQTMSASMYANPHNRGCVVNRLDATILSNPSLLHSFAERVMPSSPVKPSVRTALPETLLADAELTRLEHNAKS